ncbi:DNA damage-induced apoptosis suppressor protein isoform X1 [Rhea pennata]|uniref:DNA damage-induced apoptosis suppressor protein isoform X1 n=1 Tax=Rhea pennata TaxID=8795 RepID=UPI002E273E5B
MSGGRALLAASVISIQNSCFVYPACQSCFSRLILDSRRFNCLKCGCTGEAKDASYRYRLSLKIADTNDLFDITVFGSCLDPFFGITAGNLQRYIQDLNQLSGETNKDTSPGVLIQAVETCFIGKRFIFGVKGCVSQDGGHFVGSSILQNCSRINRGTKNLTACQIFLPNTTVTGFTVISYFHQLLQCAKFGNCSSSSYLPDASSAAIDQPVSELSSLSSLSRNSCFLQSSGRESFLGSWQQSFSLTSSVAWITAEDFPSSETEKLMSEQNEQEERPVSEESCTVSLSNQTLWDSQFHSSSVRKGNKEEDNESSSQSNHINISAPDKLEGISSSKTECSFDNSSRLLQNLLEFGVKNTYPESNSGNDCYPEKSPNSLFYKGDASPSDHVNVAEVPPTDSMLWDELPFSESLNEFLARIEDKSVVTSPSLDTGRHALVQSSKLDTNIIKSYPKQPLVAGNLHEMSILGKFLSPVEKASWESMSLACFQSNANLPVDEVSQCESFCSALSLTTKGHETSFFRPNPHQLIPSQTLPVASEPSPFTSRSVQSKEANISISNSACSFISLQGTAEHKKTLCLRSSKTAACVPGAHDSCSVDWENKENYSCIPSQKADLACLGAWDSDPATPSNTRKTYKRELKPLTELQENTFRSINKREMLWNSGCPEGSYNASADLFDASEIAKTVEFLNKSHNSSLQEGALTEKGRAELAVDVPCNNSKRRSSLHRSPPTFRKHSTPAAYSFCDSECNSVTAQDFVPYSQSTPVAKPLQKICPVGERSSFVTIFTPKNLTKIHSKCNQSRPSFQNTLLQQLTGKSLKRERPSNRGDKESNSSASLRSVINSQLPEDDFEWIPPSTKKRLKPTASLNFKTVSLATDLQSTCKYTDRNPTSEGKFNSGTMCFRRDKLSSGNTARILTTPVSAGVAKALFLNDTVLENCSALESKNRLSCKFFWVYIGRDSWLVSRVVLPSPEPFFPKAKY